MTPACATLPGSWRSCGAAALTGVCIAAASMQPAVAQDAMLPVVNHVVIVIDSALFGEVTGSSFLTTEFAGSVTRTTPAATGERAGTSFFGRHTWIEFSAAGVAAGSREGDVEIGLAIERAGGVAALAARLTHLQIAFDSATRLRTDSTGAMPWVQALRPAGPDSLSDHARSEVIEFTTVAARAMAKTDSLSIENRTGARFIAQYFRPDRLLRDVTGATLAVPVADITRFVRFVRGAGIRASVEGERAVVYFDNFTLRLVPPWSGPGVKSLEFALTRDVPANPVYRFGARSHLRFGPGRVATWDFGSP